MIIIDWPETISPALISVIPPGEMLSTGRTISGSSQSVPARRAPFGMVFQSANLFGSQILAWRAVAAHLAGGGRVRVPLFDALEPSDAAVRAARVPHSDGTPFSDGSLYSRTDVAGLTVTLDPGMRSLTLDFGDYGAILQAGQYFGIGGDPHIATAVEWNGSVASIRFESGTKRTHTDAVFSLRPTMVVKLADNADAPALPLQYGHYGEGEVTLIEALDGPFS